MDYTYRAHIQLAGTRPRRFGLYLVVAWAVSLFMLVFLPSFSDHLMWIPSQKWLSLPGPLFTPFAWGTSAHINAMGLVLSGLVLYLFGGRLHNRLGTPRLIGFCLMSMVPALLTLIGLSFIMNTAVIMLGPALAVSVLLATAKIHNDLPILYKNYMVGNTKYLAYLAYAYTGIGLLINLGSAPLTSLFLSMAAALLGVTLFFDRRLFSKVADKVIPGRKKPKLWGMRGGRWGNN